MTVGELIDCLRQFDAGLVVFTGVSEDPLSECDSEIEEGDIAEGPSPRDGSTILRIC